MLIEVMGSDLDENVTHVPSLRVATRNGQLSGLWKDNFPLETGNYYSSDEEIESDINPVQTEKYEKLHRCDYQIWREGHCFSHIIRITL